MTRPIHRAKGNLRSSASRLKEARVAIIAAANQMRVEVGSAVVADNTFCRAYNAREIAFDAWIYETVRSVSPKTLYNWRAAVKRGDEERLAGSSARNREGTSCLALAHDGKVAAYISALLVEQPYLRVRDIRQKVADAFGETLEVKRAHGRITKVALPSIPGFERYLASHQARVSMRETALRRARQAILKAAEVFRAGARSGVDADEAFCRSYNERTAGFDAWVYEAIETISRTSLTRWRDHGSEPRLLKRNRYRASTLSAANDGAVASFIALLLDFQPELNATQVRRYALAEFGETLLIRRADGRLGKVRLPPVHEFRRYLTSLKGDE